jgi:hypothetical protein
MKAAFQSSTKSCEIVDQQPNKDFGTDTHVGDPPPGFSLSEDRAVIDFCNFRNLPDNEWVISPKFTCARREWKLHLNPCDEDGYAQYHLQAAFEDKITVDFDLDLRDYGMTSFKSEEFPKICEHGAGGRIRKKKLSLLPRFSPLTIYVRIRPHSDFWIHHAVKPIPTLSEYISKLFNDEESADVAFKVKNEMFYAHQHILKLRAVDLASDFCDSCDKTNPLPIDDVDPKIFCIMLKHSYGMDISTSVWNSHTKEILDASGKYGFSALKGHAETWYITKMQLTVNNAIDELLFADGNNLPKLKKRTMDYIIENGEAILASETFARLNASQELTKEVMGVTFQSNKRLRRDLENSTQQD